MNRQELEITSAATRLGKTVVELEHISCFYDGIEYIHDFSYILLRDDRVGIIGPNGAGKTTLMDIIAGRLQPDSGTVTIGQTVKIGYFPSTVNFPTPGNVCWNTYGTQAIMCWRQTGPISARP